MVNATGTYYGKHAEAGYAHYTTILLSLALVLILVWVDVARGSSSSVVKPVVGGNLVAPGIDIEGNGEGIATMDVIVLAVARLVEVDTRSFFNPNTQRSKKVKDGKGKRARTVVVVALCRATGAGGGAHSVQL
jgi:hypothetical protein